MTQNDKAEHQEPASGRGRESHSRDSVTWFLQSLVLFYHADTSLWEERGDFHPGPVRPPVLLSSRPPTALHPADPGDRRACGPALGQVLEL